MERLFQELVNYTIEATSGNIMLISVYAGLLVMGLTSLGAMFTIFSNKISSKGTEVSLFFAAGVMIVASFTSLILPGIEKAGKFYPVGIGIVLGILLIYFIEKNVPYEHILKGYEGNDEYREKIKVVWLIFPKGWQ
ncbi:MAG: hypothetical protein DRP91_08760 [Candidatus Neomarinimicrobiota bacterium]|mgnify:CR=1 FL=1|nr:MAG: hypothetical protein DRP91_08760 [Candidatus Neomarinimicrobiota bacterium]